MEGGEEKEGKESKVIDKDSKKKRLDRSARVYKSQYNKPLILNDKDIEANKHHIKKNIKWKISTPKYTQINLKKGNLVASNELPYTIERGLKNKGDFRDKSSNGPKKGKHFIEITKITTWKNARGISADEIMDHPILKI